jgi:ribulose bisphosphate carboxylase small subunit
MSRTANWAIWKKLAGSASWNDALEEVNYCRVLDAAFVRNLAAATFFVTVRLFF